MRKIAVINQKGGVGKTTTCANVGHALAMRGKRVVAVDMDPQGHLETLFGLFDPAVEGLDQVLLHGRPLDEVLVPARENLLVCPAGRRLIEVEQLTEGGVERGRRLSKAITGAATLDEVDFLLIDCPPSSGLLAINALFCADEVIVPMPGDYLALHGLSQLTRLLRSVERMQRRSIHQWVALTRFHPRRRLAQDVRARLLRYFPGRVLGTAVREAAAVAEAPGFGKTIFEYRQSGHGAEDYAALADDLLNRRCMV
jgi:chromosome partitioning protein